MGWEEIAVALQNTEAQLLTLRSFRQQF